MSCSGGVMEVRAQNKLELSSDGRAGSHPASLFSFFSAADPHVLESEQVRQDIHLKISENGEREGYHQINAGIGLDRLALDVRGRRGVVVGLGDNKDDEVERPLKQE